MECLSQTTDICQDATADGRVLLGIMQAIADGRRNWRTVFLLPHPQSCLLHRIMNSPLAESGCRFFMSQDTLFLRMGRSRGTNLGSSPGEAEHRPSPEGRPSTSLSSSSALPSSRPPHHDNTMSSTNFAAAQERVLERRRLREAEARARRAEQRRASPINPETVQRLPYPLNRVPGAGWSLWNSIKGRDGTRPAFRVGQVDAELLDEELLGLMKNQVGDALKYFGPQMREEWSHEILFALRAILFKLSIWDHNASYGAALQGLRYTDSRSKGPVHSPPTKWQKTMYGLLTVGGRYAWDKWESWLVGQEGGYEEPSQEVRMFSRITDLVSTTHSIAAFVSFLVFLVNGRYRTLVDRILRIRLTPPSAQASREVSFEYLNRQLVWHAFTEFLLFLLPLVGIGRWKRWISRAWRKTVQALKSSGDDEETTDKQGELAFLPERTCAICYRDQNPTATTESDVLAASAAVGGITGSAQTDITNPYETIPCGCVYCFVCIVQKLEAEEGQGWVCLRCGEVVKKCQPWNGDVLEEARSQPGTGKIVGFAIDDEPRDHSQEAETDRGEPGKSSPLEEITADEALQHSSEWSTDEKEPAEDGVSAEANGFIEDDERS